MVLPIMTQLCLCLIEKGCQKVLNMISTISGRPDYAVNREYGRKHHSHLKGEVVENVFFFKSKPKLASSMLSKPGL